MIIDCRTAITPPRLRCFVDGQEIHQVFYVDTEAGIAKTYDVAGDGEIIRSNFVPPDLFLRALEEGWDMPWDGAASKTVRGTIELRAIE